MTRILMKKITQPSKILLINIVICIIINITNTIFKAK